MAEVSPLSGRVSPRHRGPIRPITGRLSLAPPFLYPLRHPPPLRSGYRRLAATGRVGLTLLSNGERRMGRLRPLVRRVMVPPSPMSELDEPTRMPFWLRPVRWDGRPPTAWMRQYAVVNSRRKGAARNEHQHDWG